MCDIPVAVENGETVVRVLFECHVRRDKLKDNVFRPKPEKDGVSVLRHTHLKSDECKAIAKKKIARNPTPRYVGVAAIRVESVRNLGSDVVDSRDQFCGHADILHGAVIPANDPPDPLLILRIRDMKDKAKFFRDPEPDEEKWTGDQIEAP